MRNILLGVSGGIAAYKSCELVREFQRRGLDVQVVMTKAAQEFVTKTTFEALTHRPVLTDLFNDSSFGTAHIDVARWADALVVAPATANTLANLARGTAPDFLSTIHLAFRGPLFIAPAMNSAMWDHAATRENLEILNKRGAIVIGPENGELACGEVGPGKMTEPAAIADLVLAHFQVSSPLKDKKVIVTAGPTREYIDPVRFLSSPSTGKMGLCVAREAARRGANVILVHGPWNEGVDFPCKIISVTSAEEMMEAVKKELPCEIFVGTAAVSDYRPEFSAKEKMKKDRKLALTLLETPDILDFASNNRRRGDLVVGFAAETEKLIPNAKLKLETKRLDLIVANSVFREERGFAKDQTDVTILDRKGTTTELKNVSKTKVALSLWDRVEKMYGTDHTT